MSVKGILKNESTFSLFNLIESFYPNVKSKYYEMILNIIKKESKKQIEECVIKGKKSSNVIESLYLDLCEKSENGHTKESYDYFMSLNDFEKIILYYALQSLSNPEIFDFNAFNNFINFNERNLIEKNDLTKYNTLNQVIEQVNITEAKIVNENNEKNSIKIYDDENWLLLKPLTHSSSVKYGYGAKWCTAMKNDESYFDRYTKKSCLIYILNKKTLVKYAFHYSYEEKKYEFWDIEDNKVDGFSLFLPFNIQELIYNDVSLNLSNRDLYISKNGLEREIDCTQISEFNKLLSRIRDPSKFIDYDSAYLKESTELINYCGEKSVTIEDVGVTGHQVKKYENYIINQTISYFIDEDYLTQNNINGGSNID